MKTLIGAPKIEIKQSVNGKPVDGDWLEMDSPKESTATLSTADGNTTELKDEKGKVVDSYTEPGTSTFAFELLKKKNLSLPFPATNGVVSGEWAIRVSSDVDPNAPAFQIDRCTLVGGKNWTKTDALRVNYTATALEPARGDMVKFLGVDVDKTDLAFDAAANSTGKTVTVEGNGDIAAISSEMWCTATVTGSAVTVTVTANSGSSAATRTAEVTITDGTGYSATVTVTQSAAA